MSTASAKLRSFAAAEHYAFVRERLRGLGVVASDLDDATQDVFEVLVRRIADYDPDRPIRAWMAGMARRVARRYRDRGRRTPVLLDERASGERSPEERAAEAEARTVLQRFLAELEPERWTVFVLSEIEGLRGSEIAVELGINQNTVYPRLRSARRAFERTLQRHGARERRDVRAIVVWPWRWSFAGQVALVSLGLGTAITLALGGVSCGGAEEPREPTRAPAEAVKRSAQKPKADVAARPSIAARPSDPATMRPSSHADSVGWYGAGSGVSNTQNSAGESFEMSVENRYRLDGDRVIYERTYIGDEDVAIDSVETTLTLDGFELVDGEREWEIELAPGETKVVSVTLGATREGIVGLRVGSPDTITIRALQPDEHRTMEIDSEQWFLHRGPDGHIDGGVQTDEDGAHVTFSGTGDECSSMSTRSPSLPPKGGPPLNPPPG